jgi:nicotinamide-nucleotide amidase
MSRVSLISVGNELLCGRTVDTNAAWLGGRLFAMGIEVESVRMVADEIADIAEALRQVEHKAEFVLVTGGLGPTDDDLTRQALASYLGVELVYRPELGEKIEAYFTGRGLTMPQRNRIQAYIPDGAEPIDNPRGTAPGVLVETDNRLIALMPGVPSEMKGMFEDSVIPRILRRQGGPVVRSANLRCFGVGESMLAERLGDRMLRGRNPLINCTVSDGTITLQVVASADSTQAADEILDFHCRELKGLLGNLIFGTGEETLQETIGRLLYTQKKTVAIAESCTGGLIAKMLTDVPGASDFFTAGWVTYSNTAKIELLGVPVSLIQEFGAVSEPVAKAMAEQAARKSGADCAIGITGIAGPGGGSEQKPVGLVYISVLTGGQCQVFRYHFANAGRSAVRLRAAQTALNLLRLQLTV